VVFTPDTMTRYLMLFNALWRAKRMEWVLSKVWKRLATLHKVYTLSSSLLIDWLCFSPGVVVWPILIRIYTVECRYRKDFCRIRFFMTNKWKKLNLKNHILIFINIKKHNNFCIDFHAPGEALSLLERTPCSFFPCLGGNSAFRDQIQSCSFPGSFYILYRKSI
jgi:hypothetical protein